VDRLQKLGIFYEGAEVELQTGKMGIVFIQIQLHFKER